MLYREYKLLKTLRKTSSCSGEWLSVYYKESVIRGSNGVVYTDENPQSMESDLNALCKGDYLVFVTENVFHLTNKGFYFWKTILQKALYIFLTSVALPIVVAVITTLVTLWLKS